MANNIVQLTGTIAVVEQDGVLVVDSRLIAERLGIEHRSFMKTVDRYAAKIQSLGVLRFEVSKPMEGSSGGRPERYCLLNEPQSNFVMTLSRNTEQVVDCKLELTQAFERAKVAIKTIIPAMDAELQRLQLQNENMRLELEIHKERQRTMSAAGLMALTAPALVEAILMPGVTVIEKVEHIDRTVIVDRFGSVVSQLDGVGITTIQKQFGFKSTKQTWAWLESIGYGKDSGHWKQEMAAHETAKLDRSALTVLKAKFAQHKGDRQQLLGE